MKNTTIATYIVASIIAAVAVFGLTILIYATFFQTFLEQFNELSDETVELISRESVNFVVIAVANIAHGFLIAVVILWGKFFTPLRGAGAAAVVAFLTEVYFLFSQYALFKTMSLPSAIFDTIMWTLINMVVGALVGWFYARSLRTRAGVDEADSAAPSVAS